MLETVDHTQTFVSSPRAENKRSTDWHDRTAAVHHCKDALGADFARSTVPFYFCRSFHLIYVMVKCLLIGSNCKSPAQTAVDLLKHIKHPLFFIYFLKKDRKKSIPERTNKEKTALGTTTFRYIVKYISKYTKK